MSKTEFEINPELRELLRSPGQLKSLLGGASDGKLYTDDGEQYPILDNGIICLLKEDERGADLGDAHFYESHPFGARDWSNLADVESGVETQLKKLVRALPGDARIIDVGAGTGRISNYLSLLGLKNVISLDFSITSLSIVKEHSNNLCIWGNNLHLPFESNSFDFVISSGVIHHTPDPHRCFEELVRILKPGGTLYLRVYNIQSMYGYLYYSYGSVLRLLERSASTQWLADLIGFKVYKLIRSLFFRLPSRDDSTLRAKYANLFTKAMVYFFSTDELRKLMAKYNMEVQSANTGSITHRMHCYVATKKV